MIQSDFLPTTTSRFYRLFGYLSGTSDVTLFGAADRQGLDSSLFPVTEFRSGEFWTQIPSAKGISLQQSADGR